MPVAWMRIPTCTPPELEKVRTKPVEFKAVVQKVVEAAGATLTEVYFDVSREYAYALVVGLDDPIKTRAVLRVLGADDFLKIITTEQAKKSQSLEDRWRPRPGPTAK